MFNFNDPDCAYSSYERYLELSGKVEILQDRSEEEKKADRIAYYKKRKTQILHSVHCNNFNKFLTLTFEKDVDEDYAKKQLSLFIANLKKVFKTFPS